MAMIDFQKILIVALVIILWGIKVSAAPLIKMGYFILPPHQYVYGDRIFAHPRGASIVYFEKAAVMMKEQVEWVGPLPLLRLGAKLKDGSIDGTLGFVHSLKGKKYLYYAVPPLYMAQPILIVRNDNPLKKIMSINDIQGYNIGLAVTSGGVFTPFLDMHRDKFSLEAVGGDAWVEQNIKKLLIGRIDAIFDRQEYTFPFIAKMTHTYDRIKVLPIPDPKTPMYVVFSKASQRGYELFKRYNAIIPELKTDYSDLIRQEFNALTSQKEEKRTSLID